MSKAIADGLKGKSPTDRPHKVLIKKLELQGLLDTTIFISTNYDLLIDSAITNSGAFPTKVNYGVEFVNTSEAPPGEGVSPKAIPLFKIHGSLNWLYCPTCNRLNVSKKKAVLGLIQDAGGDSHYQKYARETLCDFCKSILTPVIVPPTFYKDMSNVFLRTIWNRTEHALREVTHIIFCGYSFPDADMHIKYLIKRVQTNRDKTESLRFTVINNPPPDIPKSDDEKKVERDRYRRFLGEVTYDMERTFQHFASDPRSVYKV